jgi:hypothetical protein
LALGFGVRSVGTRVRAGGLRGVGGGAACCRTQGAGRRAQDAVKPGIHGVGAQWIRGFMAFHGSREPAPGAERARASWGWRYGMMWDKGGVWGRDVI